MDKDDFIGESGPHRITEKGGVGNRVYWKTLGGTQRLTGRIFGDAMCGGFWKIAEEHAIEDLARRVGLPLARIKAGRDSEPESEKRVLLGTAQVAGLLLMRDQDSLFAEDAKLANDLEAISRAEAFDRLLRAQAANE
jgi:hypothetical protein